MPVERHASRDQRDSADKIEPALPAEPTEKMEATEATEPIERTDPAEPMHRIEPAEPIDKIDPLDPTLTREPAGCPNSREPWPDAISYQILALPISGANQILGAKRGAKAGRRRATQGDTRRRSVQMAGIFRRRQATSSDGSSAPHKRGVTGSNPVAPTRFSQVDADVVAGKEVVFFLVSAKPRAKRVRFGRDRTLATTRLW